MELLHVLAGALVGFTIGLTGVGGGSLMTPILILGFKISPSIAVGTDLLYAAMTKANGVIFHHRQRTIDWGITLRLALGSVPASLLTIVLIRKMNESGYDYDQLMTLTLGIMLMITSIVVFCRQRLNDFLQRELRRNTSVVSRLKRIRGEITILAGLALGFLVTLSSVGAGAIGTALLFLLYPKKRTIAIVGTDLAHAVPLTAIAGLGHWQIGSVDPWLLGGLLLGGLPAIYAGSLLGKHIPDKLLRPLVALILLTLGVRFSLSPILV